ncbi:MAG TPA: TauD/TfdA family dioxygenase [Stellaceae bacterium]|jgi:taurine dioxygenase|nr:TauD/TfdA family dioxygenase [Stellaceae bacterium]
MMKLGTITVEPLSEAIGGRVTGIDLSKPYGEETADFLRRAFAEYGVLCFPAQDIDGDDQIRFANIFGRADADPSTKAAPREDKLSSQKRGIMYISNIRKDNKPIGDLPDGELQFHSDGSHRANPYRATTLYGIKVTTVGGETRFSNLTAAYAALPEAMKAKIDKLQARHVYDRRAYKREEIKIDGEGLTIAAHPLVRTHPDTGRKSLYLSYLMARDVVGMDFDEGEALLLELCAHAEKPEFVYAHCWTPRDLLIWDNRTVNHARNDFPTDQERHLRRITISEPQ